MRNKLLVPLFLMYAGLSVQVCAQSQHPVKWTRHKAKNWFNKRAWLNDVQLTPHSAIDKIEFAKQYHANQAYWDKAISFLKEHDLNSLATGKYPIDGTNVFATITADPSKDFDKTQWESHRKYIDLQCVITGDERMGKASISSLTVTKPYDEARDVANYSGDARVYDVPAGTFIIFFPADAHRPNITPGGNKVVKKIVIKVAVAN